MIPYLTRAAKTSPLIQRARDFAKVRHASQLRNYTNVPYWMHTEDVADLVASVTGVERVIAAALLHDTLEDTSTTYGELINRFGIGVATLVWQVTNPSTDPDRAKRATTNREHLAAASPAAMTIKLADLIDNTKTIEFYDPVFAKTYLAEKRALLPVLKAGSPMLWEIANDQVKEVT